MKAAIIGTGRMGRRHIRVAQEQGLELAGLFDVQAAALTQALQEYDLPESLKFTDPESLLKKAQPDVVIIATTAPDHCALVCLAARCGVKYVFCEKPMAVSLAECDQMLETCAQYGSKLAINHQMRFMEQYTKPKAFLESSEFGGFCSMLVTTGNMGLCMNGIHYFEAFRYLTGEEPISVAAWFSSEKVPNPRGPQFEDQGGCVRVTSAGGKRFYLECGVDQGHGLRVIYSGRNGQIYVDEGIGRMSLGRRQAEDRALPTTRYFTTPINADLQIAPADVIQPSRAVLDALLQGEPTCSGEDGRLALSVLVAAYVSNEAGHREVALNEVLPRQRRFPWA